MPSVFLETFGCQMNELDSELVRGQLIALGYQFTAAPQGADIVLFNTCSVREQAENKVLSRLGLLALDKARGREVVVGVIGCMAERMGEGLLRRFPQVDLMCGPGELDKLPRLIDNAFKAGHVAAADRVALQGNRSRRSTTLEAAQDNLELLDLSRAFDPDRSSRSAYVRITRGCNKFCTYCVVPYTRGAEVHRPPDAIVEECRRLAGEGVVEVTLLGQTVNHYLYVHGAAVGPGGVEAPQIGPGAAAFSRPGPALAAVGRATSFADLLRRIHEEVPAIARLRFVTSFPRDFGDDILAVMAASPRICRYLHLPAQSGSNAVLARMNRGYTREEYLNLIQRARAALPDVCVAGDFIVGFPGETDDDFAQTRELLEAVRFKNSFIFKYSPRPGTLAERRLRDDVPEAIKRRRNNELLEVQSRVSAMVHAEHVGRVEDVFVEQVHERATPPDSGVELRWQRTAEAAQLAGRTSGDLIVVADVPRGAKASDWVGAIVPVRVTESAALLLRGVVAGPIWRPAGPIGNLGKAEAPPEGPGGPCAAEKKAVVRQKTASRGVDYISVPSIFEG
jgi:tRNA-2-methylthio-N6-dimethylallyladenosine synthase